MNVTAREIIRLWENRMLFSGLFLLGDVPFTDVIITATVLAVDGRRMSKSLGTGIDPLEAVDRHGADATRYGLLKMSSTQDVRFCWGAIEEGQRLANKLWNVVAPDAAAPAGRGARTATGGARGALDPRPDRRHARRARRLLPSFEFARVVELLYHLVFDDFCDWYAEAIKPRLYADDEAAIATALAALEELLVLLHPVMPHVTEEIWSQFHDDAADRDAVARATPCRARRPATRSTGCRRPPSSSAARASCRPLEGEEKRIFDAVVKPERVKVTGDVEAECSARAEGDRALRGDARERALRRGRAGRRGRGRARTSSSGTAAS